MFNIKLIPIIKNNNLYLTNPTHLIMQCPVPAAYRNRALHPSRYITAPPVALPRAAADRQISRRVQNPF